MIGAGIAMFMTSTDDLQFGYDIYGDQVSTAWTGVMLLFLFLFFDSFTSQFQSRMFQRHRDLSMVELMFATSAFSTVLSFVTLVHTKELYPAVRFVMQHSEIHLHFLLFSLCSTVGQVRAEARVVALSLRPFSRRPFSCSSSTQSKTLERWYLL